MSLEEIAAVLRTVYARHGVSITDTGCAIKQANSLFLDELAATFYAGRRRIEVMMRYIRLCWEPCRTSTRGSWAPVMYRDLCDMRTKLSDPCEGTRGEFVVAMLLSGFTLNRMDSCGVVFNLREKILYSTYLRAVSCSKITYPQMWKNAEKKLICMGFEAYVKNSLND